MISTKTLSLPVVAALIASTMGSAQADITLSMSSTAAYRQREKRDPDFIGGTLSTILQDGDAIYVLGCARPFYWPPNIPLDPCPGGSTGYVLFGQPDPNNLGPYFWFTEVIPALVIEPRRPELCLLKAAPASDLPRPYAGFIDDGLGVYYNLHDGANVREYKISRYTFDRTYKPGQRKKFEDEIVPGVYHFAFPRLGNPQIKVPITPVIYPIAEGATEKNNQKIGVRIGESQQWTKNGFMELSYIKPNIITWSGFNPAIVHPGIDSLYFSMRFLADPKDPKSAVSYYDPVMQETPASVFPSYVSGNDPRILLRSPFVDSFTLPPVFLGGMTAVIELELQRSFKTGGITYDFSNRKFQIPIVIVNRYSEYQEMRFGNNGGKIALLDDKDGDGFNNLTEWILESRAEDPQSVPINPVPVDNPEVTNSNDIVINPAYFGFTVIKKRMTRPSGIRQIVQFSTNGGKTWKRLRTNANWLVTETAGEIRVESQITAGGIEIQPPNAVDHIYRVKVTMP